MHLVEDSDEHSLLLCLAQVHLALTLLLRLGYVACPATKVLGRLRVHLELEDIWQALSLELEDEVPA